MLRTQIFQWFIRRTDECCWPDQKGVFRRNINPEFATVADHIEDILGDDGRLPDHPDRCGALRQDESRDVMILLDYTAVSCPGGGNQIDRSLQALHGPHLVVVAG